VSIPENPWASGAASGTSAPSIADISYRNYDGELRTHALRWWVVALATIRQNVNRTRYGYWIPAALILIIYFFLGVAHYLTRGIEQQMEAMGGTLGFPANPYALTLYQGMSAVHILLFVAALTVGSASIAADNRANALLVYLAKPITRADYLIGKWVGVFLLLAALSVAPALLMYLFFLAAYYSDGFLKDNPTLFWRLLGATLIPPAIHASLMLGFSAWSKSPRMAGAAYAAFYFVLAIASSAGARILQNKDHNNRMPQTIAVVSELSVDGASDGIAQNFYDVTPQQIVDRMRAGRRRNRRPRRETADSPPSPILGDKPALAPMLILAGAFIVLPLDAAATKIRAVEVVRG
jgi:ABC-2 type transport system permease protein